MSRLSPIRSFLGALLRRRRLEREIDQELEHHLVSRADDLRARGMAPEDAQRVARREFGDLLRWKEQAREAVGVAWVDACRADVRYGLRWLRRSPAFAATAVLSLAIGIGANAAIFSLLDTVLLQALPVHHPQGLTVFSAQAAGQDPSHAFSYEQLSDLSAGVSPADRHRRIRAAANHRRRRRIGDANGLGPAGLGQLFPVCSASRRFSAARFCLRTAPGRERAPSR